MEFEKEFALIGGTLIDGNGGTPVNNTTVVVRNGVIHGIGDQKSISLGKNIQCIDISEFHLMPGLIDCHVHFAGVASGELVDWITEPTYLEAIRSVCEAHQVLDYGFTTVRSGGSRYDVYLKRAIDEGTIVGPRILASGLALCRTRGTVDSLPRDLYEIPSAWLNQSHPAAQMVDGVEEIRKAVRKLIGQNIDQVSFYSTGGDSEESDRTIDMHFSMEEMKSIVNEARMAGLKVMSHAENILATRIAVELGVDTIEHADTIRDGTELDEETCKKMAEKNIFICPTLSIFSVGAWGVERIPEHTVNGWKRAIKNGVKILLGSDVFGDPDLPYGRGNIGEIKLLVDILGMTPLEAITSGTKYGAEACGLGDKVGTIEKGKLADLLVVKGDPTRNIDVLLDKKNIKYIIKEGNLAGEH